MDILALVGALIGVAAVLVAMFFKHVPFSALLNPAAFFIIIVGTIGAVIIATPANELKNIGKLFGIIFGKSRNMAPMEVIDKIVALSEKARKEGLLSLEGTIADKSDAFFARGLQLLVDGTNVNEIYESLEMDIQAMQNRHAAGAQIFTQAGTYAPTLGVLGAVLGLIAALGDLSDVNKLGAAISAAFVATLLGIFTGYVLWHPMANRLKRKSKQELLVRTLTMEGLISLGKGTNTRKLRDDLLAFIPESERGGSAGKKGKKAK